MTPVLGVQTRLRFPKFPARLNIEQNCQTPKERQGSRLMMTTIMTILKKRTVHQAGRERDLSRPSFQVFTAKLLASRLLCWSSAVFAVAPTVELASSSCLQCSILPRQSAVGRQRQGARALCVLNDSKEHNAHAMQTHFIVKKTNSWPYIHRQTKKTKQYIYIFFFCICEFVDLKKKNPVA